jgi:hypothetical protein
MLPSKKQHKRMHFPSICKEITDYDFSKKCCNVNCIYNLVYTHSIIQVAKASQLARANAYHTNAECAHEELQDLLKSGQFSDAREVFFCLP